jgi:UDP-N-acetylmuramoyl-tripeptide--D-alanyl-D-alanine ligase
MSESEYTAVCIDSRAVGKNSLFVALVGTERNGHDFIPDALEKGAAVIFAGEGDYASRKTWYENLFKKYPGARFEFFPNTLTALQNAAEAHAARFPGLVKIGITGSSGKTTTKEIVYNILSQKFDTICNEGNLNTETGLPLSVFRIGDGHEAGVFELGMNRKGEIEEIARVLKPKYAIVTNIGNAHVGLLGSVDAIAFEKKQIFKFFTDDCTAIIPRDDCYADFLGRDIRGNVLYYDTAKEYLKEIGIEKITGKGIAGTELIFEGEPVLFSLPGTYNFKNLVAAVTLARAIGLSKNEIIRGIDAVKPYSGRSEVISGEWTLIRDCYNANPVSMEAALGLLKEISVRGKKIAVLGDMFELGAESPALHKRVVLAALDSGAELVLVGPQMRSAFESVSPQGRQNRSGAALFDSWDDEHIARAADFILASVSKGDAILVKGSRATGLERLAQKIIPPRGEYARKGAA